MSRVAIVTGGNRGIGLAITKALQAEKIKVAVVSTKIETVGDLHISADLTDPTERHRIIKDVMDKTGNLDILVNNAGAMVAGPIATYSLTDMKTLYNLMVEAPFDLSRQAIPYLQGGHIVNILSTAALQGTRFQVGYVTAKHALLGLTRAMAVELAPGIRVNAVAPGLIDTEMTEGITGDRKKLLESITPAGRFGKPEEVAHAVTYLINSKYVYGETMLVDGGWLCKNG